MWPFEVSHLCSSDAFWTYVKPQLPFAAIELTAVSEITVSVWLTDDHGMAEKPEPVCVTVPVDDDNINKQKILCERCSSVILSPNKAKYIRIEVNNSGKCIYFGYD